jgi:hypothetical protein
LTRNLACAIFNIKLYLDESWRDEQELRLKSYHGEEGTD